MDLYICSLVYAWTLDIAMMRWGREDVVMLSCGGEKPSQYGCILSPSLWLVERERGGTRGLGPGEPGEIVRAVTGIVILSTTLTRSSNPTILVRFIVSPPPPHGNNLTDWWGVRWCRDFIRGWFSFIFNHWYQYIHHQDRLISEIPLLRCRVSIIYPSLAWYRGSLPVINSQQQLCLIWCWCGRRWTRQLRRCSWRRMVTRRMWQIIAGAGGSHSHYQLVSLLWRACKPGTSQRQREHLRSGNLSTTTETDRN